MYRLVSVGMHEQGQMNRGLRHVKELLFDAKRAKDFMHEKRKIRKTLNNGELHILKTMAPMMKRMQERVLGHIELVKSHLREEEKHFNETTKLFEAQVAPLKAPMQKDVSDVNAMNKKIDQYKRAVKDLLSQRQRAEKSAEMVMKQCSESSKHMIERKETLNDISDRMQETQIIAANKVAKMRMFWLRAVYRYKQATNASDIDGPTPFEDTPDVIEKDTLKLGSPAQLKKALFSMYNEVLMPQQAKMKEDVVPPNDVIKNVAKLDAMISLEVDAGFDSWKAAIDARNRSLDGAIVASRLFQTAENSFAVAEYQYKEEKKTWDLINRKYTRQKSLVEILKSRLAHLNEVSDKLEAERSTYELKYENLMADDEDRINEKKRAAEGQVDRIERLVSDQDSVIASAEDEESKSERAMEESKRQVKRLKDLKATARGRTVASKDAAALGDVNANAAARMSEVQHDAMNAAVQATEFLETGVDPNKALADSKG